MHRLREWHQRRLRVGPFVKVHHRALRDAPWCLRSIRDHPMDATVGQVLNVVERRHVNTFDLSQAAEERSASTR